MHYFEFKEPYYALIKAENYDEAVKHYIETVSGEDEDYEILLDECNLVSSNYAIVHFVRSKGENGEMQEIDVILEVLNSNKPELLLIDGSLI